MREMFFAEKEANRTLMETTSQFDRLSAERGQRTCATPHNVTAADFSEPDFEIRVCICVR
jgi:hypothetical protein